MAVMPEIIAQLCNACGACVSACRRNGLVLEGGVVRAVPAVDCDYCTVCEGICPTGAIRCPYDIVLEEE